MNNLIIDKSMYEIIKEILFQLLKELLPFFHFVINLS